MERTTADKVTEQVQREVPGVSPRAVRLRDEWVGASRTSVVSFDLSMIADHTFDALANIRREHEVRVQVVGSGTADGVIVSLH